MQFLILHLIAELKIFYGLIFDDFIYLFYNVRFFLFCKFRFYVFIPRLKLALGVLTSVEQLVPVGRRPGFLEVPRGSPRFLACLDVWTFRLMVV